MYFSVNVAQGVFRPFTPAGIATFRVVGSGAARMFGFPVADPLAGPTPFAESGGRIFIDATTAVRSRVGRALMPKVLDVMEARSAVVFRALFDDPRLSIIEPSRRPFLRHVGGVALRFHVPPRLVHALLRPAAGRAQVERLGSELDTRLAAPAGLTAKQRLDWIESVLLQAIPTVVPRVLPVAAAGFVALWLARRLLGTDAHPGELQTVLRGVPHNVTTEMDLELWHIATRLRDDEDGAQRVAPFLDRYGHRAVAEIDLGMPRWSDDPRHLLGVLTNYRRMSPAEKASPDQLFASGAAEAEAMIDTLANRVGPTAWTSGSRAAGPHPPAGRGPGAAQVLLRPDLRRCPR